MHTYKNLLAIHCLHDKLESLDTSVAMARQYDAHLEVLVLNLASPIPTMALVQNPEYAWSSSFGEVLEKNSVRVKEVRQWLKDKAVRSHVTSTCQQLGLVDDDIAKPALYADLVIYTRSSESLVSGLMAKALEGAVFDAGKPALILADGSSRVNPFFNSATIAWDPAPGAMKAITASLSLLSTINDVELVVVSRKKASDTHEQETMGIRSWLSNHAVNANLTALQQDNRSVSDVLLEYVNSSDRDLFVMGAYGHSRLTERLFSGVSHQILEHSHKTLFIAH